MRRALVARLDNLGDVLVSGPAVRAVAADPGIDEVWMLCSSNGSAAARMLPGVSRVAVWDCPWITSPSPVADDARVEELRRIVTACRPEVAVILTSFHQSPLPLALLLRLAGVPRIIGASVDYPGTLLDVRLRPGEDFDEELPEPLRALAIAEAAGFPLPAGDDATLRVTGTEDAAALLGSAPYVAVHPGVSVPARSWPAERFAATVRELSRRGIAAVVTGSPGERGLTREVAGEHGVDLGGLTPLPLLAGVLAGAAVAVTANTGPAHLAAAVGTPVVSLFAPVVPAARWAPYGVPVRLLGDQHAACAGSRATVCPVPGHPCLTSVTPDEVVAACSELAPRLGVGEGVPA